MGVGVWPSTPATCTYGRWSQPWSRSDFTLAVQRRVRSWWLLLPLALATWTLVHAYGVNATVAEVLLGFAVPVLRSQTAGGPDSGPGLAEHFEHRLRPISAGVAVPVFAFFAAGVTIGGLAGLAETLADPVAVGIVTGLVAGKAVRVFGTTYLVSRFTRADLDPALRWLDVLGVTFLAGIGFTVSLLIGDLAFGAGTLRDEHVKGRRPHRIGHRVRPGRGAPALPQPDLPAD